MNTNVKLPHKTKDLNPKQQTGCKECVDCLLHFPNTWVTAWDSNQMLCPEATCIFQCISNMVLLTIGKILDLTENSIIIQSTDVLPQPLLHEVDA